MKSLPQIERIDLDRPPLASATSLGAPVTNPFGVFADANMPWLARAVDPTEVELRLQSSLRSLVKERGRVILKAIRVTRYKPGRRCLIEYDLNVQPVDGLCRQLTVIGKIRAKGPDEATYLLHRAFWDAGFDEESRDQISVPEPLGVIPEFRMWLQTKISGVTATELLTKPEGVALARRIADAAHKVHRAGIPAQSSHTMADELRILQDRLERVAQMQPAWTGRLQRLLQACERLGRSVPETKPCGIHRDFYPAQITVDGARLWLLDFDLYCQGDPGLDIGNFLGHVTEQSLRGCGDPFALRTQERAMEDRFLKLAGEAARPAVRAYAVLTLARHVFLSAQFPERQQFSEAIFELCEEQLHQLKML